MLKRSDPNLIGSFGRTLLHEVAAMRDHITEEEAMAFASVALDAERGWACATIYRRARRWDGPACWGRAGVAAVMLERGADPLEDDAEPWARPQAWAEKMGRADVFSGAAEVHLRLGHGPLAFDGDAVANQNGFHVHSVRREASYSTESRSSGCMGFTRSCRNSYAHRRSPLDRHL